MTRINTQLRLAARPTGLPTPDDWTIVEEAVPAPSDGHLLVEVQYLSIDPGMRGWMNAGSTYMDGVALGEVMRGFGIARVVESRHPDFATGDAVSGSFGVQRYALSDGVAVTEVDTSLAPAAAYLGVLGLSGLTAYFGLLEIGRLTPGETVLISGAAGSVGSVVGQIAKIHGCNVIGIAGGEGKCRWLVEEVGFDAAVDYKSEDLHTRLNQLIPHGADIFFDNVGGEVLDAGVSRLARGARVVLCGAISQYNAVPGTTPAGITNYEQLLIRRASMTGFIIFDYADRFGEGVAQLATWLRQGKLRSYETLVDGGVADFPETFLQLFRGGNAGKLILALQGR